MKLTFKILLLMFASLAVVSLFGRPLERGFNCNDSSIREPFLPLQISVTQLLIVVVILPICVIISGECLSRKESVKSGIRENAIVFIFGVLANMILVLVAKNLFGRLRPHAIQFCNANHYCPEGLRDQYVANFECVNEDYPYLRRNVRHSFYSGHASLAIYSGVYVILYLNSKFSINNRNKTAQTKAIILLLYLIIFKMSLYPGFTQWYNYWHFASDVMIGYCVGILSAIFTFKLFKCDHSDQNTYISLNNLTYKVLIT